MGGKAELSWKKSEDIYWKVKEVGHQHRGKFGRREELVKVARNEMERGGGDGG